MRIDRLERKKTKREESSQLCVFFLLKRCFWGYCFLQILKQIVNEIVNARYVTLIRSRRSLRTVRLPSREDVSAQPHNSYFLFGEPAAQAKLKWFASSHFSRMSNVDWTRLGPCQGSFQRVSDIVPQPGKVWGRTSWAVRHSRERQWNLEASVVHQGTSHRRLYSFWKARYTYFSIDGASAFLTTMII